MNIDPNILPKAVQKEPETRAPLSKAELQEFLDVPGRAGSLAAIEREHAQAALLEKSAHHLEKIEAVLERIERLLRPL